MQIPLDFTFELLSAPNCLRAMRFKRENRLLRSILFLLPAFVYFCPCLLLYLLKKGTNAGIVLRLRERAVTCERYDFELKYVIYMTL
ncbi:hypothetical protein HMPREF1572_00429 [Gardnerella vaginalis JCP7275]|nr:hypothetical protein HMPREF1572_00429 [Gardnerella vaginalis JCP7275]